MRESVLFWLICAFFLSLYLPEMPVVSNILVAAMTVHLLLFCQRVPIKDLLKNRPAVFFALVFGVAQVLSAAFSMNHTLAFTLLVRRSPLIIFPLGIGLAVIRQELRNRIFVAWCLITTLTTIACLCSAFYRYRLTDDTQWLYDDNFTRLIHWQSSYFAMCVNLTLFTLAYFLWRKMAGLRYRVLIYGSIGVLLACQYLLASRVALIVLYTALVVLAVGEGVRTRRYGLAAIRVVGVMAVLGVLRLAFPKTQNRFRELQYTGFNYASSGRESHFNMPVTPDQWNGANIRLAIWKCGLQVAKRHWLTGIPLAEKQDSLNAEYKAQGFEFAYHGHRNTHNTYLDVLINTGVIGLAAFLLGWVVLPLLACMRGRDGLGAFVIITFAAAIASETYIDRSLGCILLGFFIGFVNACEQPEQHGIERKLKLSAVVVKV